MGYTYSFATDAIPPAEAVIAQSLASEVTVYEDGGNASTGFTVQEPNTNSPAINIPPGGSHTFRAPAGGTFRKGDRVGYVAAASGTLTLAQIEK